MEEKTELELQNAKFIRVIRKELFLKYAEFKIGRGKAPTKEEFEQLTSYNRELNIKCARFKGYKEFKEAAEKFIKKQMKK